jgi:hypothetical protein
MNENQRSLIRKIQRYTIPVMILVIVYALWPHITPGNKEEAAAASRQFFKWAELLVLIPFLVCAVAVFALMREFFSKRKKEEWNDAADANLLLQIEAPHQLAGKIIAFLLVLFFAAFMNLLLFAPNRILEQSRVEEITWFEKGIFFFFYILVHFLVIAFGRQLLSRHPLFIATTRGFQYTPAGISTGWVLWEDIEEIRESSVLYGNQIGGPTTIPALGIKFRYPEKYAAMYNPTLQKLAGLASKLHNYQTEGVGDLLLNPADFGKRYEEVKTLMEAQIKLHQKGNRK